MASQHARLTPAPGEAFPDLGRSSRLALCILGWLLNPCLLARGVCIRSASPGGRSAELRGMGMAAPHVTGAVILDLAGSRSAAPGFLRRQSIPVSVSAGPVADRDCGGPFPCAVPPEAKAGAPEWALMTWSHVGFGGL